MGSSSLRQVGLLGAAAGLAGGLAYAAWTYFSARRHEQAQAGAGLGAAHRPQDKPPSRQILVLGLDGAGKTSVLHSLATNHVKHSAAPTEGFNAVCINTEETQLYFLEIGGSESLRSYWKMYLPKVLGLIYVVDSADHTRLPLAKHLLHQLVQHDSTLPVVVLANKQDIEGAYCITDIHDALALSDIGDERKMFLIGTHVAQDGSEISSSMKDAKELIAQLVLETA
ncbi:ADP-ribosylation factor-like protein 9 isoform X2 [Alligator mississippiensis]|uniref:ADP-ribosylation factor-like protein 9 isoform X2 n=1 Tax=Alligator mississippiensis TaxID=8496 RepID=UPI0003D0F213|nr:ADP-ribosylation factor-like protein 9 isoform X2 [Alligator mississippiensis]